jgi:Tfp pilus assembly protein PilO
MTGDVARSKRRFTLILAVLGVVDVVLIGYLLLSGSSPSARLAREQALQQQVTTLNREVAPLHDIGEKLAQTRVDVKKFYEQNVPSQFSEISKHLERLVQQTGVTAAQGFRYTEERPLSNEKNNLADVQRISIDTTVSGEYAKVARFINALEQDKFVFVITQIGLNSSEGGNLVSLQIKFETFLKET